MEFSDNGPGFPEPLLEQIFDPYVTTKDKGTGLGLAINRRLVKELGGDIRAENRIGGGATVIIHLLTAIDALKLAPAQSDARTVKRDPT